MIGKEESTVYITKAEVRDGGGGGVLLLPWQREEDQPPWLEVEGLLWLEEVSLITVPLWISRSNGTTIGLGLLESRDGLAVQHFSWAKNLWRPYQAVDVDSIIKL